VGKYHHYVKKPRRFLALTGYTSEEFTALLPEFERQFYARMRTHRLDGKLRGQRRYCDYANSPLPTSADKLFFILHYLKTNNLQEVQGAFFGMTQPKANQWLQVLHPVLNLALAAWGVLPARDMACVEWEEPVAQVYLHDGTERSIPRPTDKDTQREYYSGKKKQHTVKNNVVVDLQGRIRFLSPTVAGKKHDKKLADESAYQLPEGSHLGQDTGFQGFTVAGVTILQPKKKPKGQPLTPIDKHINAWLSAFRVRVEHAIGGAKRYRIVKERIRNWKKGFRDQVLETCCGLHNFRLRFRPWHYPPIQLHLFVAF